ncbi:MAG: helix-turn-helix domain-containing protein [Cellulomonadaceae bacterium]|nr:helix-turn-helix domain-containing protein [Cellulomonadaceae bacterium]
MSEIREARLAAGLTQQQVAHYAGVTQSNIAAYEAGTRPISPAMKARILKAMRRPSLAVAEHAADIKRILNDVGADNVRVFGSIASGKDTPTSDVDLLVDYGPRLTAFSLARAQRQIADLLGFVVDIVTASSVPERKRHILDQAVPV